MSYITLKTKTKYGTIYKRSNSNYWQLYTLIKGKPFRKSTGISIEQDKEGILALEVLQNITKMNYYVSKKNKSVNILAKDFLKTLAKINDQTYDTITLHSAIYTYLNSFKKTEGTLKIYQEALNDFKKFIKTDVELDTINLSTIENYRSKLINKNLNPNTINHKINYINIFFNHLIKEGFINENPCKHLTKLETRIEKNYIRPFTNDELKILLNYVKGTYWETAVLISLYTGARIATVFNLTWNDVDFTNNTIRIYEKKNHKEIIHNLHPQLRAHLLAITDQKVTSNRLVKNISDKSAAFREILLKIGLITKKEKVKGNRRNRYELCFHSLRHNFSTALAENPNISAETRLALVGHSSLEMNARYNQINNNVKIQAINSLPNIDY